jgi:hypothetical protein
MMPSSHGSIAETPQGAPQQAEASAAEPAPTSDYDEWEMEERLRHLDRVYARSPLSGPLSRSGSYQFRIDAQHSPIPREQPVAKQPTGPGPSWLARLGRLILGLGLSVTVCGGCLMMWAQYGARPDLMPIGIPIAVVGQILLLLGLVSQFDSAGRESRQTAEPIRNRPPLPIGNTNYRFDDGPNASPQLTDLAARLEELSRKLDNREER